MGEVRILLQCHQQSDSETYLLFAYIMTLDIDTQSTGTSFIFASDIFSDISKSCQVSC